MECKYKGPAKLLWPTKEITMIDMKTGTMMAIVVIRDTAMVVQVEALKGAIFRITTFMACQEPIILDMASATCVVSTGRKILLLTLTLPCIPRGTGMLEIRQPNSLVCTYGFHKHDFSPAHLKNMTYFLNNDLSYLSNIFGEIPYFVLFAQAGGVHQISSTDCEN